MSPANPEVLVFENGEVLARWALAPGEYGLGRASRNKLKLVARGVSRDHARISVVAGEVFFEDLGSRYGTPFEGKPIAGWFLMKPGQQLRIGGLALEVREPASSPAPELPQATLPPPKQPVPRVVTARAPLARQPLKELQLDGTPATNLVPLIGLPLESLTLDERISDLSALRGLPLRELDLRNHTRIRDFRPLLECRRLDIVYVPENADIDCLREHPSLKFIAIRDPRSPKPNAVDGPTLVFYFWQKYGPLMRQRKGQASTDPAAR